MNRCFSSRALALVFGTLSTVAFAGAASGADTLSHPGRFAPFVDVTLYPTFPLVKDAPFVDGHYTLAFITSDGACKAAWGGEIPIAQGFLKGAIAQLRSEGGDVIASFGGQSGTDLAESCTDLSSLKAQYQKVVNEYALTSIDFDVEGGALSDPTGINLRNQAIAELEAANPQLKVSYTLPVATYGLTSAGTSLLANAEQDGARVDLVNIMAMDFGPPEKQMGNTVIAASNATLGQLSTLYPSKTAAQLRAMFGVTPMIGDNDTAAEVVTLADAQQIVKYVTANGIGRIAMWSEARDRTCPKPLAIPFVFDPFGSQRVIPNASPTCSGVQQKPFAFSTIFSSADN